MGIDIFFVCAVAYGFYFGFTQKIFHGTFLIIAFMVATSAAARYMHITEVFLRESFEVQNSPFTPILAFAINLLAIFLTVRLLLAFIRDTLKNIKFSWIHQLSGGLLMALMFVFLYSNLIAFFVGATVIDEKTAAQQSKIYPYISDLPEKDRIVVQEVRPWIEKFWRNVSSPFYRKRAEEALPVARPPEVPTLPTLEGDTIGGAALPEENR